MTFDLYTAVIWSFYLNSNTMNIYIPYHWLLEYLDTSAKPNEIAKYLSLCGPSVERIEKIDGEPVFDIEITTNRVDSMSIYGIAREAAAILPEFGIAAALRPLSPSDINSHQKLDFTISCSPNANC